jgi:hypothetical protein
MSPGRLTFDLPEGISDETKILFIEAEAATMALERARSFVGDIVQVGATFAIVAAFSSSIPLQTFQRALAWLNLGLPKTYGLEASLASFGIAVGTVSLVISAFSFLRKSQMDQLAQRYARQIAEVQMIAQERPSADIEIQAKLKAVLDVTPPSVRVDVA